MHSINKVLEENKEFQDTLRKLAINKPNDKIYEKAVEELLELSVILTQANTKKKNAPAPKEIYKEMIDVQMALQILQLRFLTYFSDDEARDAAFTKRINKKIAKFLKSEDVQNYIK